MRPRHPGGLLSDKEIRRLCTHDNLIAGWCCDQLRPAAYNIRVSNDGLVTPDGKPYKPVFLGGTKTYDQPIILAPGDVAELSSREQLNMPDDIAGNITIRTDFARRGLLLLSGLLVDPGYGRAYEKGKLVSDGRLHFYVANIGHDPVAIIPNHDSIAAVQFFRIVGGKDPERNEVGAPKAARWDGERPEHRLGFISNLKELREAHEALAMDVHNTKETTMNVLILGYFLLAVTILGLTLNNLLSVGSDPSLVERISRAVPDSVAGKVLLVAAMITVAWTVRSLVLLIHIERLPKTPRRESQFYYEQARESLVAARSRWRIALLFVGGLMFYALVELVVELDFNLEHYLWPVAATGIACGLLYLDSRLVTPVTAAEVRTRAEKLTTHSD